MGKPGFDKKGNIKLGANMWTFSKLYGNEEHKIDRLGLSVVGTCGKYCEGCKHDCYVRRSYRYGSVIYKHAINTIAMRTNKADLFSRLNAQLTRAKNKPEIVRINQAGEIETAEEFRNWAELARLHNYTQFYVYTKALDIVLPIVRSMWNAGSLPENITILISIWHDYGVDEFIACRHIPNIKAFVYNDGFDYGYYDIKATTKCNAYNGRILNHDITCDKCRKCFSRRPKDKVIFCDSH